MRKRSGLAAGLLLLRLFLLGSLMAVAQPEPGVAEAVLQEPIQLQGRIRNWQLGEGYYVVVAVPEVRSRVQAVFPERFDAARISADGGFDLLLQHEPPLTALLDFGGPCPAGQGAVGTSFHYLAVTTEPQAGRLFNDVGLVRPMAADPELLVFFTFLQAGSASARAAACPLLPGWNIVRFRPDVGLIGAYRSQPPGLDWLLIR